MSGHAAGNDYTILLEPLVQDGVASWAAEVPDLPGCGSSGDTAEEAARGALEAIELWKETAEAQGLEIPEPKAYSGRFTVRVPRFVHKALDAHAKVEGTSLNLYVASVLAQHVADLNRAHTRYESWMREALDGGVGVPGTGINAGRLDWARAGSAGGGEVVERSVAGASSSSRRIVTMTAIRNG